MKQNYETTVKSIQNSDGPKLCWSEQSGMKLIEKDGLYFKDLAGTGELYPYEDWRLPVEQRASDLASRMSVEQIAGLMLYSRLIMGNLFRKAGFRCRQSQTSRRFFSEKTLSVIF